MNNQTTASMVIAFSPQTVPMSIVCSQYAILPSCHKNQSKWNSAETCSYVNMHYATALCIEQEQRYLPGLGPSIAATRSIRTIRVRHQVLAHVPPKH